VTNQRYTIAATGAKGITLRAAFNWWVDRYGHAISVVHASGRISTVFTSIEGDANDAWPASPPLQSISVEEVASGRNAALLVGMAGRSHWSASVEAIPDQAALVFDVACRIGSVPAKLGSRYTVAEGQLVSGPGDKKREFAAILLGSLGVRVYREHVPGCEAKLRLPESGELVIRPDVGETATSTVRWRYRIEVAGKE
jgi:hypothetical protein